MIWALSRDTFSLRIVSSSIQGDRRIAPSIMAGEHLDLVSEPFAGDSTPAPQAVRNPQSADTSDQLNSRANSRDGRRFVGVTFACCDIYARVYINRDNTAYEGRCPRCCKPVQLKIGPGGVDARFFTAY